MPLVTLLLALPATALPSVDNAHLRLRAANTGDAKAIAFSPDGKCLAAGYADKSVRLWDLSTGNQLYMMEGHDGFVGAIAYSPNGKRVATGSADKTVRIWDVAEGRQVLKLEGHRRRVDAVAFSPNGKILASAANDGMIRIWDATTGTAIHVCPGHGSWGESIVFSADGSTLTAHGPDHAICSWDVGTGREQRRVTIGREYTAHGLATGGNAVILESQNHRLLLWDLQQDRCDAQFAGPESWVVASALSSDHRLLALANWKSAALAIWDLSSAKPLLRLDGPDEMITCLTFSPERRRIAAGGDDGTILVWNLPRALGDTGPASARYSTPELEALWADLGSDDPGPVYRAIWKLAADQTGAVGFLKSRMKAAEAREDPLVRQLIAKLDDDHFAVRQQASQHLRQLGKTAQPALRRRLAATPSAEARRRMEDLLEGIEFRLSSETRQQLRGIHVLEEIAGPECIQTLKRLASGDASAPETLHAVAALQRLGASER